MALLIPNTALLDAYDESTTFAGGDIFQGGFFTIANNPAAVQLGIGAQGQARWADEQYLPPATYPIVPGTRLPVSGLRARNFIAGSVAQLFGGLTYPGEPSIQAGTPYTSTIAASGAIVPDVLETYNPQWTSSANPQPAIQNGSLTGRFLSIGALTLVKILLAPGTLTTFGTGVWFFSLPVAPIGAGHRWTGTGFAIDISLGQFFPCMWKLEDGAVYSSAAAPVAAFYGPAAPFAWAAGDQLDLVAVYGTGT